VLHEQRQNDGLFLSVKHGGLCLESKEPKEGYELVEGEVNGDPYSKYIKKFAGLDGVITKVEWYERTGDYGTFRGLKLTVKDRGEHYLLDLPFEKRPYDYFTKVAENIDYSKPVEIAAWPDRKGGSVGKIPTAFAIKQDGKFVQWKYTREDMGECPPAKQLRTGKWSFDDQREWLLERILTVVVPHVEAIHAFDEPEAEYDEEREAIQSEQDKADRHIGEQEAAKHDLKTVLMNKAKAVGGEDHDPNDPLYTGPDMRRATEA
jgi:hypothetical protein